MITRLIFFLFLFFTIQNTFSQEIILSVLTNAGDYNSSSGYNLSWTLGEVVTETFISDNTRLTQGFQQSDLLTSSGLPDDQLNRVIVVYPNPVSHDLNITLNGLQDNSVINISLMDIMGRTLMLNVIKDVPESYNFSLYMENLDRGIYILRVYTPDLNIQRLFKIEKL